MFAATPAPRGARSTTPRRRSLLGAALAVTLTIVAACGGDDDDDVSSDATSAPTAASTDASGTDATQPADTTGGATGATTGSTGEDDGAGAGSAPEATVDTITIGVPSLQEQYVDPHFAVGGLLFPLRYAISETLYRQDLNLEWVPNLATDYEISEDGLTWTFTLRDDVTMHDGSTFTANDVKTAVDRILGSEDFAHLAQFKQFVTGATVVDDTHVEVTTNAPYATLLSDMPVPIPTDYYNEVGEEGFRAHPMQAGAWKFVSQELNSNVTYERFDDFFDESRMPNFQKLVYEIVPDESSRLAGMQTGALDMAYGLTAASARQLEGNNGVTITEVPDTALAYIFLLDQNFPDEESPLLDADVRRALLMAIDREAIAESLFGGHARVPDSIAPPTMLGYQETSETTAYDPDEAKRLLEEAGAGGVTLTLNSYNSTPSVPDVVKLAETIAAFWEAVGLNIEMNVADSATILPEWRAKNLRGTGLLAGPSQFYDEPSRLLSSFFASNASYPVLNNPDIDALRDEIAAAVQPEDREPLGSELQQTLDENQYALPIILVSSLVAVGPNVASFEPMASNPYAGPLWGLVAK
jgi:peptide/nickel transport system substrate-binding protein